MSMNCVVYAVDKPRMERLQETEDDEEFFGELQAVPSMELGQAWHGLHYLLTGTAGRFAGARGFLKAARNSGRTPDMAPRGFSHRQKSMTYME